MCTGMMEATNKAEEQHVLDGFSVYHFYHHRKVVRLTLRDSVYLSYYAASLLKIGRGDSLLLWVNEASNSVAFTAAGNQDDMNGIVNVTLCGLGYRLKAKGLVSLLRRMSGCKGFKCDGFFAEKDKALSFDLKSIYDGVK